MSGWDCTTCQTPTTLETTYGSVFQKHCRGNPRSLWSDSAVEHPSASTSIDSGRGWRPPLHLAWIKPTSAHTPQIKDIGKIHWQWLRCLLHWLHELPDFGDASVALNLVLASVQDALLTLGRAHASSLSAQLRRAGLHCSRCCRNLGILCGVAAGKIRHRQEYRPCCKLLSCEGCCSVVLELLCTLNLDVQYALALDCMLFRSVPQTDTIQDAFKISEYAIRCARVSLCERPIWSTTREWLMTNEWLINNNWIIKDQEMTLERLKPI